jgi:hypothetical protein
LEGFLKMLEGFFAFSLDSFCDTQVAQGPGFAFLVVDFTGQLEGILGELLGESGVIVAVIVGLLVEAIYGLLLTLNLGLK